MAELRQNTWTLDQWYDQDVAGNVDYSGATETWVTGAGGMVVWRLQEVMSVRVVFGCICDDPKLVLRWGTPRPP